MKASHVSPRSAASATVQSLPQGVAVQGAPVVSIVNGTVNVTEGKVYVDDDTGSIGPDGKRQGVRCVHPPPLAERRLSFMLRGHILHSSTEREREREREREGEREKK
jgi:hypothetical protein